MSWPAGAVDTTDTDSGTDNPQNARADILDMEQKINLIIAHVSSYIQGLLDDADAATARATLGLTLGTQAQAWDADLDALAAFSSTGIAVRTALNTWVQRSIAGTANQITLTNGDGVSGNPTVSLPSAITLPGSLTMGGLLDLGSTGQIQFPATQNASAGANVFDDYEEGTWTVTITFGGGVVGQTYSQQVATYTKIGRDVFTTYLFSLTAKGTSTGVAKVSGLPFTSATGTAQGYNAVKWSGATTTAFVELGTAMDSGGTNATLFGAAAATTTGPAVLFETDFANTTTLTGHVRYFV